VRSERKRICTNGRLAAFLRRRHATTDAGEQLRKLVSAVRASAIATRQGELEAIPCGE
jgi:hypothetical protein